MSPRSPFPTPSELLIHDHFRLKDLFAKRNAQAQHS